MPAGPIGPCWALGSWVVTAWEAGTWAGITPPIPTPPIASGFIDTISRRRVGFSTALVLVEAYGDGLKRGINHSQAVVVVGGEWVGFRTSIGKSYADLRPYRWATAPLNERTAQPSDLTDEEQLILDQYYLALVGKDL